MSRILKSVVCSVIGILPCAWWPAASAVVRRVWPGFREGVRQAIAADSDHPKTRTPRREPGRVALLQEIV
jgi:hypothetical protein